MGQQIMFTNITSVDGVYLGDEGQANNDAHIVCTDSLGREHVIVMHPFLLITAYNMMMDAIVGEEENEEDGSQKG